MAENSELLARIAEKEAKDLVEEAASRQGL